MKEMIKWFNSDKGLQNRTIFRDIFTIRQNQFKMREVKIDVVFDKWIVFCMALLVVGSCVFDKIALSCLYSGMTMKEFSQVLS